jgi:predicted transposase YbfD/YdcC
VHAIYKLSAGQVIAIDGKTLRRSHDRLLGREAIQIVSAWAQENHLVLAQTKVDTKSNEITAIPELLKILGLTGSIITIDAIGCQRENAEMIVDRGGDYVLAVKGNQGNLYEDAQALFEEIEHPDIAFIEHDYHKTVEKDHGRIETRRCWTLSDQDCLTYLRGWENWKGLKTVVMVESTRVLPDTTTKEVRYFISSLPGDAERILAAVRGHWSIENSLHWVLDIAFREDESRLRTGYGAENMAVLRHMALNLLKQDHVTKAGVKNKRLRAALDNDYLLSLLAPS